MSPVKVEHAAGPGGGGPLASLAFLLSQLGYISSRGFHQALAPLGLEPRHFMLLGLVARDEGRSQQSLGDLLGIPPSRMVALVDQLEARGLLERRANPNDRRARALHVTAEGRRAMGKAFQVAVQHDQSFGVSLTPAERGRLVGLLQKLAAEKNLLSGIHPAFAAKDAKHD